MPRRFSAIAGILLMAIAVAQAARALYGIDITVNGYHVPFITSWILAAVAAFVGVLAFREAHN